ncbi:glycosyltransferase family 59 protein [Ophiostoma piceae UAMH 11346]|uniref:Dol-P-Glc:Glc(2)Man(9)GlcNAc(2)-PP-Dol alpha-1,2-glucosyltransferase n=1 Tax=Ophiostoma piceae (strain UAMH 11346) TaxID=1262450 RepID=S3C1G5_OPHP1|nr:glycosyltransferase family 59 protein [Ophiostoma piceae UAMH 11346]
MEEAQASEGGGATLSLSDPKLKAFLASTLLALPGLTWQAWVLGVSFRQRRGKPVADTNALAEGAAALQAAASAAKRAAGVDSETTEPAPTTKPKSTVPTEASAVDSSSASAPSGLSKGRPLLFIAGVTFLFLFAKSWLARVLALVPEAYLDEVFHIPQAQTYCDGRWFEWDDKITTPPGLYVVSVALKIFWTGGDEKERTAADSSGAGDGCSVWALRAANNVAIMLVAVAASSCRAALEASQGKHKDKENRLISLYAFHSAINVALFPVLFFFSALYYTDVYSTLAVLLAYRNHLYRVSLGPETAPVWTDLAAILLGLVSLAFRQTNIFWVVVYMGGLEAVHAVKRVRATYGKKLLAQKLREQEQEAAKGTAPFGSLPEMMSLYSWKYAHGDVHDPPLSASWPDDWALSLVASVGIAAVCNVPAVLRQVWPHLTILASFAGFVAWNGGVVLGDKANHVATLHFAQLLYVWALMAFFSAPLFVVHAAGYAKRAVSYFNGAGSAAARKGKEDDVTDAPLPPLTVATYASENKLLRLLHVIFVKKAYYPLYLVAVFDAMLAIVRYNTLVHPFTLADNRHYMFYVFRYTIRHSLIRYALVPAYCISAWACWRVLWAAPGADEQIAGNYNSPFVGQVTELEAVEPTTEPVVDTPKKEMGKKDQKDKKVRKGKGKQQKPEEEKEEGAVSEAAPTRPVHVFLSFLDEDEDGAATAARTGPTTTTALLWLAATSLSLVTAPLVEPRYFILPWVFWRLLVPASTRGKVDVRLLLETVWFVAINVATMYMFLYRPYVWRAADGTVLDGGRLQRFMW